MYLFLVILCGFFAVITIFDAFFVTWIIYDKSKKWSLPEWFNKRSILLVIVTLLTCILNLRLTHFKFNYLVPTVILDIVMIAAELKLLLDIYRRKQKTEEKDK